MLISLTKGTPIRIDDKHGNFYRGEYEHQTQDKKTICFWENKTQDYIYIPIKQIETITIYVDKMDMEG